MTKATVRQCRRCGAVVTTGGVREEKRQKPFVVCEACLDEIFPERGDLPVHVDGDGNLYFTDSLQEKLYIFFGYGDQPYSSVTEVSTAEDYEACCEGFPP